MGARLPLMALLAVGLAACSSSTPSPQRSASAHTSVAAETTIGSPSPEPTGTRAPEPSSPDADLQPGSVAKVITTDLVMRSAPGTGEDSEIYEGRLHEPALLFVIDGPVLASGYEWYRVQPFTLSGEQSPFGLSGWVAAADKDGEPWIASEAIRCNRRPQVDDLIALGGVASLACYGGRPLSFAAYEGPTAVIPNTVSPSWLVGSGYMLRPIGCVFECGRPTPTPTFPGFLFVHRSGEPVFPNGFASPVGAHVQVTGHFDDPAAQTCTAGPLPGDTPPPPAADTVLLCRTQFVVTEMTQITH
jgi:hypothetical protein